MNRKRKDYIRCPYADAQKPTFAMTDKEILRNWRNARNKAYQVRVLAELNARSVKDTIDKLLSLGIDLDTDDMRKYYGIGCNDRKMWTQQEIDKLVELKAKGALWKEIAYELGRSSGSVQNKYLHVKWGGYHAPCQEQD